MKAQALLEKLRYYAEQTNRPYVRMEAGLLSAITKERAGGPWQDELTAVLREAESYRFLRLITEEGAANTCTPTASPYGGSFIATYTGRNGASYNGTTAPTNAGDYTVTISLAETGTYIGSLSLDFTITVPVSGDKSTVRISTSVSGTTAAVSRIDTTQIENVIGDNGQTSMVEIDFTCLGKTIDTVKLPAAAIKDIAVMLEIT